MNILYSRFTHYLSVRSRSTDSITLLLRGGWLIQHHPYEIYKISGYLGPGPPKVINIDMFAPFWYGFGRKIFQTMSHTKLQLIFAIYYITTGCIRVISKSKTGK